MLHLRWTFAALLIGAGAPIALTTPALAQACACAPGAGASEGGYVIQADEPPPPLPEYDQPPIPAPGYYWTPGYWAWNNYDYYWVPGAWIEPPQAGLLWTPGYWALVGGAYAFGPAIGANVSDSTAGLITGSAILAPATKAAAGTMGASSTMPR